VASRTGAAVVASFRRHQDAERAAERLRDAGVSDQAILLRQTVPGLLESLLPVAERSGKTTIEVRGRRSQSIASRVLSEAGAQEVTGSLNQEIAAGSGSMAAAKPKNAEIVSARAEIEAAATDMNQTIRAIQDRLNPDAVKARAKDAIKEATVGRVERTLGDVNDRIGGSGQGLMDRVKQNPMPAALTGIGLTWLFLSKRPVRYGAPVYQSSRYGYGTGTSLPRQGGVGQSAGNLAGQAGNVAQQVGGSIGDTASQITGTIGDTAAQVTGTIGDTAAQVGTAVGDTAAQVGDTVGAAGEQVRYATGQWVSQAGQQAQRLQGSLSRTMEENPLPVGIAVLGLGALVAALMPKTSAEEQILGETRDRLMDKAQEVGQKVGRVAERAGTAAKDEAQSQNLA
jgi:hypothetical protein